MSKSEQGLSYYRALAEFHNDLMDTMQKDPDLAVATKGMCAELRGIASHLVRDPECWTQTRAFHVVHIPAFATALGLYKSLDKDKSEIAEDRQLILKSFKQSKELVFSANTTLSKNLALKARIEIETLASRVPFDLTADDNKLPETFSKSDSSWSRFMKAMPSKSDFSIPNLETVKSAAVSVTETLSSVSEGVSNRFFAIPKLGSVFGQQMMNALADNVKAPVAMRLSASGQAIQDGIAAGAGLGIVIGILFPPLLPIAGGGAVLAALDGYNKALEDAQELDKETRHIRDLELMEKRKQALYQLTSGAPSLQMETDMLSLTLDVNSGKADALLLSGKNEGRSYSSLTMEERKALKNQTKDKDSLTLLNILELSIVSAVV